MLVASRSARTGATAATPTPDRHDSTEAWELGSLAGRARCADVQGVEARVDPGIHGGHSSKVGPWCEDTLGWSQATPR